MSQAVPDNRSGRGALDISVDIQSLEGGNGLVESGWNCPASCLGWTQGQVPKESYKNKASIHIVCV